MTMSVSVNSPEWADFNRQLAELKKSARNKVIRQAMRRATRPVLDDMKARARSYARVGRGNRRRKGTKSIMRVVAGKLKLRAMKRTRRPRVGFRILIAATGPELEALRGNTSPLAGVKGYAPAHIHFGVESKGGKRVTGKRFMQDVADERSAIWLSDFERNAHIQLIRELNKK